MGQCDNRLVSIVAVVCLRVLFCGAMTTEATTITTEITEVIVEQASLSFGSSSVENSIRILDFIEFREHKHEAELIVELIQEWSTAASAPEPIQFVKERKLEVIRKHLSTKGGVHQQITKVRVTIPCHMKYVLYPHESHDCDVLVESEGGKWKMFKASDSTSPVCAPLETYEFKVKGYFASNLEGATEYLSKMKHGKEIAKLVERNNETLLVRLIVDRASTYQIFSQMYSPLLTLTLLSFLTLLWNNFPMRIATSMAYLVAIVILESIFWMDIPRAEPGDLTAIENYFMLCFGFVVQVVFTNVLMYGYLSMGDKASAKADEDTDVEADRTKTSEDTTSSRRSLCCSKKEDKQVVKAKEEHILKMGKCHQFLYFKGLKPAKVQLPLWFLIINVIYWVIVLSLSSGIPLGFREMPDKDDPNRCF